MSEGLLRQHTDAEYSKLETVTQAQKERLCHIDFRLHFMGAVNRNDLVSRFGIKEAAASRDLSLYKSIVPGNIEYDTKAKTYIYRTGFKPLFLISESQTLTALLHGFGDDFIGSVTSDICCEAPTQLNFPQINALACITRAIFAHKALAVSYRSLSSGQTQREIVPFALVDNGLRWHVRAYDRKQQRFTDFVLNRFSDVKILEGEVLTQEEMAADEQWNCFITLELAPHPQLQHPKTIEYEYQMSKGVLKIDVRAAVAGYLLRRWNVDCSFESVLRGEEYQLCLVNKGVLQSIENKQLAPGAAIELQQNG